ncbi:MAG TPA: co-chaperone GroES [Mycobacteriales bacterium]|nr:co-chaperone GroES [Mycobacteriales bacterium]
MAQSLPGSGRLPIRMLHDRVLVKVPGDEGDRRSSGGILIPPTAQVAATRLVWGEVLATGNHVRVIEVGDQVLFSPEDPNEVEVQAQLYLILRERDVHAVAAARIEESTGLYL